MVPAPLLSIVHRKPKHANRSLGFMLLVLLPTCSSEEPAAPPTQVGLTPRILRPAPTSEVALWQRVTSTTAPEGRFLQAMAFDETRGLLLMFGGQTRGLMSGQVQTLQDIWEWSPPSGAWTLRPASGVAPAARGGAAIVFDPSSNKLLLFGGRAASGYNYEDLWEWDPTTGAWSERGAAGTHPTARAQHAMLYQKSTGKILLFGGGRSSISSDGTSVSASLGDTWELDPATSTWTARTPSASPSMRHDFGLVWDSARNKAVLFGGLQIDIPGATGVPKQDIWEWDPSTQAWTERTTADIKPVQRFGHAMAYDGARSRVVVFGGSDMQKVGMKNDMWDWDPATGSWTQSRTGAEAGMPGVRSYSSLLYDGVRSRLEMVAGLISYSDPSSGFTGPAPSNEVWELEPTTLAFTNRSVSYQGPAARANHAMAYNPTTGKVYVFSGLDQMKKGMGMTDLWEWDGSKWSEVVTEDKPSARIDAAMAYDPVRHSLILFGGTSWSGSTITNDTWEWDSNTRKWSVLAATGNPSARWGHAMVTDTLRKKILLFGGSGNGSAPQNELWEWDGATLAWSNRTPAPSATTPVGRVYPVMSFDETRGKLMLYDGSRNPSLENESTSAYWEWDTVTGGWAVHDPGETLANALYVYAVYDPFRRRHVLYTDGAVNGMLQTWELDASADTWFTRTLEVTPGSRFRSAMVFDSARRVAMVFGGNLNGTPSGPSNDAWEYAVKNLANGEGCAAATASSCASGQCVDGVCCESASCTGPCMACNVRGSEGTCILAQAGTEVPGSCSDGQACDGTGACKSRNGQACSTASGCASGFCVDGICCDTACTGACKACNLPGRIGICTPSAAGTDPNNDCGQGTGACQSSCDGVGACVFPLGLSCGTCLACDGAGACTRPDPACGGSGGMGGTSGKDTGKPYPGTGGTTGSGKSSGGTGGKPDPGTVSSGGSSANLGGSAGTITASGGTGGVFTGKGGNGGSTNFASGGQSSNGGSIKASGGSGGIPLSGSMSLGGGSGPNSSSTGSPPRDAGAPSDGSTDGSTDATRDGGGSDGRLTGRLSNRGCGCDLGQAEPPRNAFLLTTLFLGTCWLASGWRRRR